MYNIPANAAVVRPTALSILWVLRKDETCFAFVDLDWISANDPPHYDSACESIIDCVEIISFSLDLKNSLSILSTIDIIDCVPGEYVTVAPELGRPTVSVLLVIQ